MRMIPALFLLLAFFVQGYTVLAADASAKADEFAEINKLISGFGPNLKADSIKPVSLPPLYEVVLGADVFYVTKDGRYMLQGDVVDLRERVNLTEETRAKGRLQLVNGIDERSMIVFAPEETKHVVTVFTDIDCPYCRKMHDEMAAYNRLGIEIRYMAFPRAGIGSESFHKAVAAWCANDRQAAMTAAKAGQRVKKEKADCEDPVAEHLSMVKTLGLTGTPALILENGTLIPGYVPAERLLGIIEESKMN